MSLSVTEIRQKLESTYQRQEWQRLLYDLFPQGNYYAEPETISLPTNELATKAFELGSITLDGGLPIGLFEIQLQSKVKLERNRIGLRAMLKQIMRQLPGALVVFVQGDKWRLSYVSQTLRKDENGQLVSKQTAPKRFTYLLGKGESALTAAQRFVHLNEQTVSTLLQLPSLTHFEEAFSVEKLSKEFFKNYKDTYEDFVQFLTGKRYGKKGNKYVEQEMKEPDWQLTALFNKDEKQARDFCKRMMGRIVFLYFIQKKGWLAVAQGKKWGEGNFNYLYDLFRKSKHKDDFYCQELVPLFFKTLNNTDSEKTTNDFRFPYLNGGLFDDSQDRKYNKLHLPEEVFARLFENFNNYNFTVYEDAPDEHTVAVDPEMLGHIFENLLEDNRDKGAFYTPKEIVHYMCKESLNAYLHTHTELNIAGNDLGKSAIEKIIQQQELTSDEKLFAEKHAYKIIDALDHVKICDPAIGSGAFPMGLLQEIFNAQIYLQELKGFKKGITDADIKKHIIEESIYGVDIDAGAVDIARLRFWLSLVVDEQEPQPLPNLDFKIICANTLIPLGEIKAFDMDAKASLAVKELEKIRHNFFNVSSENKLNIERQFKKVQTDLLNLRELATKDNYEFYTKLYGFNPFDFQAAPCSWFDPWWMFGIKDGFDIVIGNPPYVQLQKNGGNLSKQFEKVNYQTFERTGDIYSLFYERGWQLLKTKGVLCFITSNKWMRAGYGESTRNFFAENTNPILLLDFSGQKIFEAATVDVNILIFTKDKNQQKTLACIVKEDVLNNLSVFVSQHGTECAFTSKESWTILSPIEQSIKKKIEAIGTPLKDWDVNIYRGILTGYNEAFIIDGKKKDELIKEDPKSVEIIRPILRGKDIKRYGYDFADKYLIATFPSMSYNIDKYPAVKKFLEGFKPKLNQTGEPLTSNEIHQVISHAKENGINLNEVDLKTSRKKTNNKWFETQDSISYWDDFSKQKIIYPGIMRIAKSNQTNFPRFALDSDKHFHFGNDCYFIVGENLHYLCLLLNSTLLGYLFRYYIYSFDETGFKIFTDYFENIPLPLPNEERLKSSENVLAKGVDIHSLNNWVYKIMGFSKEEISEIENSVSVILNSFNESQ